MFERECPYAQLIECEDEEVLCKLSGQCIAKTQLCDGIADCPDGQDETLCDYDCSGQVSNLKSFQCGGKIAFLNSTHYQLFEPDLTGITDPTDADKFVAYESKAKLLETNIFNGSTGACIAIEWRCDGVNDCDDGTDEVECSLFTCADDEYQCSDTGSCIPKSWLCDGVDDCNNKEDENKQICLQNGATISSSGCVADGYYYECSGFSDICLYEYNMCDGYQDCPYNDDEEQTVCDALSDASSNSDGSGSTGGTASCGDTLTGTGYQDDLHSYTFTMPSGMTEFKLSTCLTANQGETYAYMYTSDYSEYIYSNYDSTCGCSYRSVILGRSSGADNYNSYTITPGNTYTIDVYQYYTGAYAISIECGTTQYSEGGTCTGGNIGSIGSDFGTTPYYYNSYSTTPYSFGNTGSSTTSGTGFASSGSSTTGFGSSGSSTTGFGGSSTTGTGTGTTSSGTTGSGTTGSGTTGSGTTSAAGTTDSGATNSTL